MAKQMRPFEVIELPIDELKPYKANPREHPASQIAMLEKSIKRFGFNNPVLVSGERELWHQPDSRDRSPAPQRGGAPSVSHR